MKTRSKRYNALVASAEKAGGLKTPKDVPAAVALVKSMAKAKFTESIDLAVCLNLDTKKADQQFRGSFSLPNGTGRSVRVIAFVDDSDKITTALAAGAVKAGGEDLVKEVEAGFMDFDVAISTPKMMRHVGKLGKVLGPRGLMPNPKTGTVTEDTAKAVKEVKAGRVEYKVDKTGNVHVAVGKGSFTPAQIEENARAVIDAVFKARPTAVRGTYVQSCTLSLSMSPAVRLDTKEFSA